MRRILICIMTLILIGCGKVTEPQKPIHDDVGEGITNPPVIEKPIDPVVPEEPKDKSLFSPYKDEAIDTLSSMTLEDKIGQMFLVRCPLPE